MLTSVLTKAVEKAMDSEVEYRRGLPVNYPSFMGSGLVSILHIFTDRTFYSCMNICYLFIGNTLN